MDYNVTRKFMFLMLISAFLVSCGRAYFPVQFDILPRAERSKGQQETEVKFVSMTKEAIKVANNHPYVRKVVLAGDLSTAAKLIPSNKALIELLPENNDPGPYQLGIGDVIQVAALIGGQVDKDKMLIRNVVVSDDGYINIIGIGKIKASGLSQSLLEDQINQEALRKASISDFEANIIGFNSKRIFVSVAGQTPFTFAYKNTSLFLEDAINVVQYEGEPGIDAEISIERGDEVFYISLLNLFKKNGRRIRLFPNDKIKITPLKYRQENVYLVGETGAQRALSINALQRHTLSDILFSATEGVSLNSVTSDFSQVYVIRQKKTSFQAFHLDITNPTRVTLASMFEMRPDDIVFVATQPLSLYSRTLTQILGSSGLTLQARDTIRSELRN